MTAVGSPMPASAPQTQRAAETAARRRRLLEAAVALANEGGYDAVQMRDVAARAQVALGTLYRHYSSKDQLLLAALADQAGALRTRLAQRPPRGDRAGDRVADALRRATRALTREPNVTAAMVTALTVAGAGGRGGEARGLRDPAHDHQRCLGRRPRSPTSTGSSASSATSGSRRSAPGSAG